MPPWDLGPKVSAEAYPKSGHIFLSEELSAEDTRSALLHEIQHLIQMIERIAMGGNTRSEAVQAAALETYATESGKLTKRLDKLHDLRNSWWRKPLPMVSIRTGPRRSRPTTRKFTEAAQQVLDPQADVQNAMRSREHGDVTFIYGEPGDPARKFKGRFGVVPHRQARTPGAR